MSDDVEVIFVGNILHINILLFCSKSDQLNS